MQRLIHQFDNGVKVYDDHLVEAQRERYRLRNVHEAEEEDVFVDIVSCLPPAGRYVNIGSAIGYYTLLAKKLVPGLQVHAVEPLPRHRQFFTENVTLNGFLPADFVLHTQGISSVEGELKFTDCGYGSGLAGFVPERSASGGQFTIKTVTLDSLIRSIGGSADLVQMDVQGAELDVLKGAVDTLRSGCAKTFIIGTHGIAIHDECTKYLKSCGYAITFEVRQGQQQPDGIIVASKESQK